MGDARRGVRLINWTIFKVFFFKLALSALGAEPFPNAREMSRSYDISLCQVAPETSLDQLL